MLAQQSEDVPVVKTFYNHDYGSLMKNMSLMAPVAKSHVDISHLSPWKWGSCGHIDVLPYSFSTAYCPASASWPNIFCNKHRYFITSYATYDMEPQVARECPTGCAYRLGKPICDERGSPELKISYCGKPRVFSDMCQEHVSTCSFVPIDPAESKYLPNTIAVTAYNSERFCAGTPVGNYLGASWNIVAEYLERTSRSLLICTISPKWIADAVTSRFDTEDAIALFAMGDVESFRKYLEWNNNRLTPRDYDIDHYMRGINGDCLEMLNLLLSTEEGDAYHKDIIDRALGTRLTPYQFLRLQADIAAGKFESHYFKKLDMCKVAAHIQDQKGLLECWKPLEGYMLTLVENGDWDGACVALEHSIAVPLSIHGSISLGKCSLPNGDRRRLWLAKLMKFLTLLQKHGHLDRKIVCTYYHGIFSGSIMHDIAEYVHQLVGVNMQKCGALGRPIIFGI